MAKRKTILKTDVESGPLPLPLKPMRRGSMGKRYTKCGKPGCRCRTSEDGRHGPYYSVTRAVDGKTTSHWLTPEQVEIARRHLADGDQFRRDVNAYWDACEELSDAELELGKQVSPEVEAEKGGFKRRSSPASSRRSSSS